MSDKSKISWTDATWNPFAGCSIVSPGCHNCYAAEMAHRLERMGHAAYQGTTKILSPGDGTRRPIWTGKVNLNPSAFEKPLRWKQPKKIFVNSMSDLFHEQIEAADLDRVYAVMLLAPWHTFQILTKRVDRMAAYWHTPRVRMEAILNAAQEISSRRFPEEQYHALVEQPLPNVWHGVSVEDQSRFDERARFLCRVPSAVRFLSCEPLLGPLKIHHEFDGEKVRNWLCAEGIGWVIVGGESGPRFRECDVQWIVDVAKTCVEVGVSVWVKQDCGLKPEQQGRIPDEIWNLKQFPEVRASCG